MWSFESVFFYSALCFRGGIHVVACIRLRIFLNLCFLVVVRSRRSLWNWEELWRLSSPASPHFRDEIKAFITWNSLLVLNVSHIPSSVSLGGGEPGRRQLCISPWLLFSCELVLSSHPVRLGFGSIHGSCSWIWGHSCLTTVEHAVYKECTRSEVYWSLPLYCIFYLRLLSCFYESFWKQRPLIWWHPANELLLLDTKFWKPDWRLCMLCASAPWCCALKGCFLWPFHLWRTCRGPGTSLLLLNFLGLKIFSFPLAGIYSFVRFCPALSPGFTDPGPLTLWPLISSRRQTQCSYAQGLCFTAVSCFHPNCVVGMSPFSWSISCVYIFHVLPRKAQRE